MPPSTARATLPRAVAISVVGVLVVAVFVVLGFWQWQRGNVVITEPPAARPVVAVEEVVSAAAAPGSAAAVLSADEVGRRVLVNGSYDPAVNLLVPSRPVQGRGGSWVLGIVRTDAGGVPVVRGWVPDGSPAPPLPAGRTEITGVAQAPEGSDRAPSTAALPADQVWVVSAALLVNRVDYRIANTYVTDASPVAGLVAVPPADAGEATRRLDWRNLAYAAQWWVFAAFAVVVWVRVLRDDRLQAVRNAADPDTAPVTPNSPGGQQIMSSTR